VLRAPIAGVVASVATQEGETVAAGLSAPTFVTIVDLERLQVDAYVDEVDIGRIQVGQRALFTVDAFPARDFSGRVAAIYPTATIQDNVVKYVVALDIDDDYRGLLRPEMTANVRIELESRDVLAVPSRAIQQQGAGASCTCIENGRAVASGSAWAGATVRGRKWEGLSGASASWWTARQGRDSDESSQRIAGDVVATLVANRSRAILMMLGLSVGVAVLSAVIVIGQGTRARSWRSSRTTGST
jgi:hypothetical protein